MRFLFLPSREISVPLELGSSWWWIFFGMHWPLVWVYLGVGWEVPFSPERYSVWVSDIKLGAALHSPQISRTSLSFPHISSPFWHLECGWRLHWYVHSSWDVMVCSRILLLQLLFQLVDLWRLVLPPIWAVLRNIFGGSFERVPVYLRIKYFMKGLYFVPSLQKGGGEVGVVYWVPDIGVHFVSYCSIYFSVWVSEDIIK